MIKWIKKLFEIVRNYDDDQKTTETRFRQMAFRVEELHGQYMQRAGNVQKEFATHYGNMQRRMESLDNEIKDRTNLNIDVGHLRGANYVILAGHYKGRDYVELMTLKADDFDGMARIVQDMKRSGRIQ